jgi:medium-chain acyl-[acyl-carrier-protein] hydrolase
MHIETWPLLRNGSTIRGYRDFNLRDEPGELLGEACSLWLLLSKETRKPVKLPDWMIEASNESDKADFLSPVHENEFIGSPTRTHEIEIRASDIDWNLHVNNVCYLEWALETLPHMFRVENKVTQLDITYVAEGNYGMVILSEYFEPQSPSPDVHYHRIVEKSSGAVLAMLRLSWSPKERIPAF